MEMKTDTKLPTGFPIHATRGEVLGPAMTITKQSDADAYFETIVQHAMQIEPTLSREQAERNLRESLGYWAGYYDHETRQRVERLFRCAHPIFGSAEKGKPSFEEALEAGKRVARAHKSSNS